MNKPREEKWELKIKPEQLEYAASLVPGQNDAVRAIIKEIIVLEALGHFNRADPKFSEVGKRMNKAIKAGEEFEQAVRSLRRLIDYQSIGMIIPTSDLSSQKVLNYTNLALRELLTLEREIALKKVGGGHGGIVSRHFGNAKITFAYALLQVWWVATGEVAGSDGDEALRFVEECFDAVLGNQVGSRNSCEEARDRLRATIESIDIFRSLLFLRIQRDEIRNEMVCAPGSVAKEHLKLAEAWVKLREFYPEKPVRETYPPRHPDEF